MRNRLGPLRSKSRRNAHSRNVLGFLARDGGVLEVEGVLAVDVGQVDVRACGPAAAISVIERRAGHRRVEHELVEIGLVRDGVLDLFVDVLGRVMFQPDDGGAQQHDAVLAQFARQLAGCRRRPAWRSWSCGDSRPSQIEEMPISTSSS